MINSFLAFVFLIITYLFIFQTSSTLSLLSSNLVYLIVLLIVIGIVLIGISFINKKSIKQNISNNYQRYLTNVAPIYKVLLYLIAVIICLDGLYNTSIFTLDYFQRFGYTLNDVIALVLIVFAGIGIIVLSIVSGLLPKRIGLYLSKEQHVSKSGRLLLILYSGINFLIISTGVGFRIDSPVVSIISLFEQILTLIQQIVMLAFSLIQLIVINILYPILVVDNVSRLLLNFLNPLSLLIINVFIILYTIGINLGLIISPLTVLVLFFDKNVTSYFKNKNASNLNSGNQSTNQ